MQVSVESTGTLERRMRVDVPEDRIEGEVRNRLQSITRTARIDGFRRGKVPVKIVQQRFGEQVRLEVLGEVMRETYVEALRSEKLNPASEPSIEQHDDAGKGLSFTAIFEVYPEVTLNSVELLNVSVPTSKVTDDDVDKMVETLRTQHSEWKEVDRTAVMGDQLKIDFIGYINDEKFEGGEAKGFDIKLGSGRLIKGFEQGLVGSKTGDQLSLNLEFPTPYPNEELAGKAVRFDVTVSQVSEPELPELNEEFFKRFGIDEGGIEAFRASIRENMERECNQRVKNQAKTRVLTALYDANPVELPKSMVESESQQLFESSKERFQQQGIPAEQLESMNKEVFEEEARRRVALGLLMSEIIKANDLKADPAKVRTMVETIAASYEDSASVVQWYYADKARVADIQTMVLEEEVVNWILERAQVTPDPITFNTLMNPETVEDNT